MKEGKNRLSKAVQIKKWALYFCGSVFLSLIFSFIASSHALAKDMDPAGFTLDQAQENQAVSANGAELELKIKKERNFLFAAGAYLRGFFYDEFGRARIKAQASGEAAGEFDAEVIYEKNGKFKVALKPKASGIKPGVKEIAITLQDNKLTDGQEVNFTQDFNWGVLAFNVDKSSYQSGEKAYLQIGVLDERGHTICDADLKVEITAPDKGRAILSTENGLVIRNPECGPDNVIFSPDYYGYYQVGGYGDYSVRITATTKNGTYEISDKFTVAENAAFTVERQGPTRINPTADYGMRLVVKAEEDFTGDLVETVPEDFKIMNYELRIKNYGSGDYSVIHDSLFMIQKEETSQYLVWRDLDIKKGDIIEFTYKFDAPDIFPEFYLLGPMETQIENRKSAIENRRWQIASDGENQIILAEQIPIDAGTTDTVNWTEAVKATSTLFTGEKKYFVYVSAGFSGANLSDSADFEIVYGSTIQYTGYIEASGDEANDAAQIAWFDVMDQAATPEDIILRYRTNSGTSYVMNAQILAINLSNLETTDWKYAVNSSSRALTTTPTADANITLDIADGVKDWLVFGMAEIDITNAARSLISDIYNGSAPYMSYRREGENTSELLPHVLYRPFDNVATNTVFSIRNYMSQAANTHLRSRVFALNLNRFESFKTYYADIATAINGTWTNIGNLNTGGNYAPQTTGDQLVFASFINDITALTNELDTRLQVNSVTVPANWGWGQSPANYLTGYDNAEEIVNNIVAKASIPSTGQTIALDAIEVPNSTQVGDEVSMAVFSTRLKNINRPLGAINSKSFRASGTGVVDIAFDVYDRDLDDSRVKVEYEAGSSCAFSSAGKATISTVDADTSATYGDPDIDNTNTYQVGTTTGWITTTFGTSTVDFDWTSQSDIPYASSTYCLRLTANDGTNDQLVSATTTVYIDNFDPVISSIAIPDRLYKIGDTMTATITLSNTESDNLTISTGSNINGGLITNLQKISSTVFTADYTVASGQTDRASNTIPYEIALRDPYQNQSATSTGSFVGGSVDANAPSISAAAAADLMYGVGTVLTATLTTALDSTVYSLGSSSINAATSSTAGLSKIDNTTYILRYTVAEGDTDRATGSIPYHIVLRDSFGNENAAFTGSLADGSVDAHAPQITSVYINNGNYKIGDNIELAVNINKTAPDYNDYADYGIGNTTVNGVVITPDKFSYQSGTGNYRIIYTVGEGDMDRATNNIPISIVLRDKYGNANAAFTLPENNSAAVDAHRPAVTAISLPDRIYKIGDTVTATLTITADDDYVNYAINGVSTSINWATSSTGNLAKISSTTLTISYTIAENDYDQTSGNIPVRASFIDGFGNTGVMFGTVSPNTASIDAHKPAVSSVAFEPSSGLLKIGDTATATLTALNNETGLLAGASISINTEDVKASFAEIGSGLYRILYTVAEGDDYHPDGDDLPVSIIIKDQAGNESNAYVAPDPSGRPGVDATRPVISGVAFAPGSGVLKIGDTATATITADASGYASGTMMINNVDVAATFAPAAGNTYTVRYIVAEGNDNIPDSSNLPVSITIKDSAGNPSLVYSTEDIGGRPGVDATRPVINSVVFAPGSGVLKIGDTATATIAADASGYASGTIMINGVDVAATFAPAGGNNYTVRYTVAEGNDNILDSENLPVSITIKDGAGNPSLVYSSEDIGGRPGVDAQRPAITGVAFAPLSGVLKIGDTATATISVSGGETGLSIASATINLINVAASFAEIGGGTYRVTYTVSEGHNTIYDIADLPVYFILTDAAGNNSSAYNAEDPSGRPGVDATRPVISGVTFAPASGVLKIGDTATATIAADASGYASGTIMINGVDVSATFATSTGNNYTVRYTVAEGNNNILDSENMPVSITIKDGAGNLSLVYSAEDIGGRPGVDAARPVISGVAFAPSSGVLKIGDIATATIAADSAGYASGTIMINGADAAATFAPAGGNNYTVRYIVAEGHADIPDSSDLPVSITIKDGAGNYSSAYSTEDVGGRPGVDGHAPTAPGNLQFYSHGNYSITLTLGATTTESNFAAYKIFYKEGASGVTENDSAWDQGDDGNLGNILFFGATSTTITGLASGTQYVFNILAYDQAGNKSWAAQELSAWTNRTPQSLSGLAQKNSQFGDIASGGWTDENYIRLSASVLDPDPSSLLAIYFEIASSSSAFSHETGAACAFDAAWDDCAVRVWATTSVSGDFSAVPFAGFAAVSGLPENAAGFKWQAQACDEDGACSEWSDFGADPDFLVDFVPPTAPGDLSEHSVTAISATLDYGATSTENNFAYYRIYYKEYGGAAVSENDSLWSGANDPNLNNIAFNGAATTTVTGLTTGIVYQINIWAYDLAGNKASATPITITTDTERTPPISSFLSVWQKADGSGAVDISAAVSDAENNPVRLRVDYATGTICDFSSAGDPYLDESDESVSADDGDPLIDNGAEYQVGTGTDWVVTAGGNTVYFDWLSGADTAGQEGYYCLRLTANDNWDNQAEPATTTVYIDNKNPTAPGALSLAQKHTNSLVLNFGATTTESNFSEYKIFYKAADGTAPDEHDSVLSSSTDGNLGNILFGAATTTISGLAAGTEYSIAIWAFDDYGNHASSSYVNITTNYPSQAASGLGQYKTDGTSAIANGAWTNENSARLSASAMDSDNPEALSIYFELLPANDTFRTATSAPFGACAASVTWSACASKIWLATSTAGDYSAVPFAPQIEIFSLASSSAGYKWQALSCDEDGACASAWTPFNAATPNFKVDFTPPAIPGNLTAASYTSTSTTLKFGAPSVEENFYQYVIYYKPGTGGVSEANTPFGSSTDANFLALDFNTASGTVIAGLSAGIDYAFNIWAYDQAGNKASATEITVKTNNAPSLNINSAAQKTNGSGAVDVVFTANDADHENLAVKAEYATGSSCVFAPSGRPTLDETDANATSSDGDAKIENDNDHQIGNSSGWVLTAGANTVSFDWLSAADLPAGDGAYCVRLTPRDSHESGTAATATLTIDNKAPTVPGSLSLLESHGNYLVLNFGATSTESHWSRYRVYYKQGVATVNENDTEHIDTDLYDILYNQTSTTSVSSLVTNTQYSFRVYAYDAYGNKSYSGQTTYTTNAYPSAAINSAALKTDGSGRADIELEIYDQNGEPCYGRLEFATGTACDFADPGDPILDEDAGSVWADFGLPGIENDNAYQIGTSGIGIITNQGSNTVHLDWLTAENLPGKEGDYCLRFTVSDGKDQRTATATLEIDNKAPNASGDLVAGFADVRSVRLDYGAPGSDANFKEYKIFYKEGLAGVTENDSDWTLNDDANLGLEDFGTAASTTIGGLIPDTDYAFNIWIYDDYGNKSQAAEISTTTLEAPSATWRELQDTPDPTAGTYAGKEQTVRLRVAVANSGTWSTEDYRYDLQYGIKDGTCGNISSWIPVPATSTTEHFEMKQSVYFIENASTTARLSSDGCSFQPGYMLQKPFDQSGTIVLYGNEYSELEFTIAATQSANRAATYCFRAANQGAGIDDYGVYPEFSLTPPPISSFVSAAQRSDASGRVDIAFTADDYSNQDLRARLDYATGTACVFSNPGDPTIDTVSGNTTANYINPVVDNNSPYQIGTGLGYILTQYGENTVNTDWLSASDLSGIEGQYCLRLTVNDLYDDQAVPATTTVMIDNKAPSAPGDLDLGYKTINSVTLDFGATSSDLNFFEYRVYYKEGTSGVTESDSLHASNTDPNLGYGNYNGATSTTINNLTPSRQYVFRIYAYDKYGNRTASLGEFTTKLVPSISGIVYGEDGVTPLLTAPNITMIVNGSLSYSAQASAQNGRFIFWEIDPPATGTPMLAFIDGNPAKGAMYSLYGGAGEVTDLNIYSGKTVLRQYGTQAMDSDDLDIYDNDQDADIPIQISAGNLSMLGGAMMYIWPGTTFNNSLSSLSLADVRIEGVFDASSTEILEVSGDWDASGGQFLAASSTVRFTSTQPENLVITGNQKFYNLEFDGAGGSWILADGATTTATTTIAQGELVQGGDFDFETGSLLVESGAVFTKATGTGRLIFEDLGEGYFEDRNAVKNDLGEVVIGHSPAVTRLGSDMTAASLTVNSGDSLFTRGYELNITNFITVNGTLDAIDDKEGDGSIITLGTNWTVAPAATFVAGNSTTTFANASASVISTGGTDANHDFFNLSFAKTAATTSVLSGYAAKISGDLTIGSNSIFDVSASNYAVNAAGNWTNNGTFNARNATTTFDAISTGKTVNPGNSPFYRVVFNSASGGWNVAGNATSTQNWEILNASSFALAAGKQIEVKGSYIIADAIPSATVWNSGSTLYLNSGTSYTIAPKSQASETYANLKIGANTDIRMWNSGASSISADSSGSLYAMDYASIDGELRIWGDYRKVTGKDYWSYATDFDGASISGAPRICHVLAYSGTNLDYSGAGLDIIGATGATTTIANQGAGSYGWTLASTSLNLSYFQIRNMDADGLDLTGTTTLGYINNGDLELDAAGGALISVAAETINSSPWSTSTNMRFATSTGAATGYNVKLTGTPSAPWTFASHYGGLSGENHDSDPGDLRGYLIWDDSPAYGPQSRSWRWYHDEDQETPAIPAADQDFAPQIVGGGNILKLRVAIEETENILGENVKMRLQYSANSDFSGDVYWVGEKGSTTAWTYGEGVDEDNAPIGTLLFFDTETKGTHNESGISTSTFDHAPGDAVEWEFTLLANDPLVATTYYFRAYADYYSLYGYFSAPVGKNASASYPSAYVSGAVLDLVVSGLEAGTTTEGVSIDIGSTASGVNFGQVFNEVKNAGQRFRITTNAENGYQLMMMRRQDMISDTGAAINPADGTNENPAAWPSNPSPGAFGYHAGDDTLSGISPSRFSSNLLYAGFESGLKEIAYSPMPVKDDINDIVYRIETDDLQSAGDYRTNIVYIIVPNY